jgi:serine/threonine-protein kinase SRPK3
MVLGDLGEALASASEASNTTLPMHPPEARYEQQAPLSCLADIRSSAVTKTEDTWHEGYLSVELVPVDEVFSQQVGVLGPIPPNQ